jgi:hypothetical protein
MNDTTARSIAHYSHHGQRTRLGDSLIEHVERVAAAVPSDARAVAFLHDVLEQSDTDAMELTANGLTQLELAALRLLTRAPGESYELYVLRVAYADGPEGRLARSVKLADLDDHLLQPAATGAGVPPYAWARSHISFARERRNEADQHRARTWLQPSTKKELTWQPARRLT